MNTIRLTSKLPQTGTTIFTVMSKLAADHNAINLSQGFPDFPISEKLVNLVHHYMKSGFNQYAPMQGIKKLREVIAEKTKKLYSAEYDPESEINITAGATQAIYTAITAVVREGDEVIVFEPAYDCYVPAIVLNGGRPIYAQLQPPNFTINWDQVKKLVTPRTRMMIINSPHNPTGSILSASDMLNLEKLLRNNEIIVVSDEVYEHIIFDGYEHQGVARFPRIAERSFIVISFGKTFHATGWKMGYCLAPEYLMKEFRKVHQFLVFTCNTPLQYAITDYLQDETSYNQLSRFYQQKRDFFNSRLKKSRFKIIQSNGTYFQLLNYSAVTDEKDTDYAVRMTRESGVASIPVSVFYHRPPDLKLLRFCFAKNDETLEKATDILCAI